MSRPRVLITPWRRALTTAFGVETDLVTLAPAYPDAIRRVGGIPIIAPHLDVAELDELLDIVDAVVVSGGHDMDPARYGQENTHARSWRDDSDSFDLATVERSIAAGIPMLGICRGLQVINVALGGDLLQEVQRAGDPDHPLYEEMPDPVAHRHEIEIQPESHLATIYGPGAKAVNSLHHQAAGRVAPGLRAVAACADGTVEAVEGVDVDILAVQWHPEMLAAEDGDGLFADLVARAASRATMRP